MNTIITLMALLLASICFTLPVQALQPGVWEPADRKDYAMARTLSNGGVFVLVSFKGRECVPALSVFSEVIREMRINNINIDGLPNDGGGYTNDFFQDEVTSTRHSNKVTTHTRLVFDNPEELVVQLVAGNWLYISTNYGPITVGLRNSQNALRVAWQRCAKERDLLTQSQPKPHPGISPRATDLDT